jgi:hypothetical protein
MKTRCPLCLWYYNGRKVGERCNNRAHVLKIDHFLRQHGYQMVYVPHCPGRLEPMRECLPPADHFVVLVKRIDPQSNT